MLIKAFKNWQIKRRELSKAKVIAELIRIDAIRALHVINAKLWTEISIYSGTKFLMRANGEDNIHAFLAITDAVDYWMAFHKGS